MGAPSSWKPIPRWHLHSCRGKPVANRCRACIHVPQATCTCHTTGLEDTCPCCCEGLVFSLSSGCHPSPSTLLSNPVSRLCCTNPTARECWNVQPGTRDSWHQLGSVKLALLKLWCCIKTPELVL